MKNNNEMGLNGGFEVAKEIAAQHDTHDHMQLTRKVPCIGLNLKKNRYYRVGN